MEWKGLPTGRDGLESVSLLKRPEVHEHISCCSAPQVSSAADVLVELAKGGFRGAGCDGGCNEIEGQLVPHSLIGHQPINHKLGLHPAFVHDLDLTHPFFMLYACSLPLGPWRHALSSPSLPALPLPATR
jgi:hypothetical protein